jgi:hypothetical protein
MTNMNTATMQSEKRATFRTNHTTRASRKRTGSALQKPGHDTMSLGRAAELIGTRHENLAKAIRAGDLIGVPHEGFRGRTSYLVTREELRRYQESLVSRYSKSPTESRILLGKSIASRPI